MPEPIGMEYRVIDISGLELGSGAPFRFRWRLPGEEGSGDQDAALVESVGKLGVISPPILSGTGDSLDVVSGFRRISAAREAGLVSIASLVTDRDTSLAVWLESSIHGMPLSEMERITVAAKALAASGGDASPLLPFLSAVFGRKITADLAGRLASLAGLGKDAREAVHEGRLSPGDLLQLGVHPGIDLEEAAGMLAGSGLSRSARREAVRGLLAIADRGEKAFGDFAAEYDPGVMPLDEAIQALTHPAMTGDAAFITRMIGEIELPPCASVRFPPNFEGGSCTVEIRIRGEDDLRISLSRLKEALEDGLFEEMLKVLRGQN